MLQQEFIVNFHQARDELLVTQLHLSIAAVLISFDILTSLFLKILDLAPNASISFQPQWGTCRSFLLIRGFLQDCETLTLRHVCVRMTIPEILT